MHTSYSYMFVCILSFSHFGYRWRRAGGFATALRGYGRTRASCIPRCRSPYCTVTFEYLTFEFFSQNCHNAGNTNPLELLLYINSFGYSCALHPASLEERESLITSPQQFRLWYERDFTPAYEKNKAFHLNLYCRKRSIEE